MKRLLLALIMTAVICAAPWGAMAQPIQVGDAVVTCGASAPGDPVLALIRVQNANTAPVNTNWAPTFDHPANWTMANLGQVFGLALDPSGNIYVTATSIYSNKAWGPLGSGGVYMINGVNGLITNFASLPNDPVIHPGLGNICHDPDHNPTSPTVSTNGQFFVTNFEDGKIYRLHGNSGTILSTYDPYGADDGTPGWAPRGERLWGIGYYKDRVYYAVWWEDCAIPSSGVANEIRSVALDASGDFISGSDQSEIDSLPPLTGQVHSNPVSDIEFSRTAPVKMLLGERTMSADDTSNAHGSRMLEYINPGAWTPSSATFSIGVSVGSSCPTQNGLGPVMSNSAGGVDYGYDSYDKQKNLTVKCDGAAWGSGDAIHFAVGDFIYGLQRFPASGGTIANSVLIDLDGDLINGAKTQIGDVDIYKRCQGEYDCKLLGFQLKFAGAKGGCCWDLTLLNNMPGFTWTQVQLNVLTAGVQFASNTAPAGWTVSPGLTSSTYMPNTGVIPLGASGPINFCLAATVTPPPAPQKIELVWFGKNGEICRDTITSDCKLPPPACAELQEVSIACKTSPPASPSYAMSFNIHNLSAFNIDFANIIVTCPGMGVSISPTTVSFPTVPPLGTSTLQNVTINGGTPGSTICLTIRVCDKQKIRCCTFDTTLRLPKCADCCDSLHIRLGNTKNTYNYDGSINYSTAVTAYPTSLRKFTATLVNAKRSVWCKNKVTVGTPIAPLFLTATFGAPLPGPYGIGTNEVTWGSSPAGVPVGGAPLNFKIKFPPLPAHKCVDTITYYIKYTYTDVNCRTCDTTACYKVIRYGTIWHPVDHFDPVKFPFEPGTDDGGGSGKTRDGDERGIQSGPDEANKVVTIAMSNEEEGTLTIVNPELGPEDDPASAITILGFSLEPEVGINLIRLVDQATGQRGSIADRVGSLEELRSGIKPGESRSFQVSYNNSLGFKAFKNYIRIRYTLGDNREDVFEAVIVVYARTPEGTGGDLLESDPDIVLANVRTYGFKFTNGNHTGEKICRVVISIGDNNDGDDIVAVGPGIDRTEFGLKAFRTIESEPRKLLLAEEPSESRAEAFPLESGDVVTPIYVTFCGGEDNSAILNYTTYTPEGEVVSTGTITADNPLAPGRLGVDDPSRPGVVNSVDCMPNPLTDIATFTFSLGRAERNVWLTVTDMQGNAVATIYNGVSMEAGEHTTPFDASKLPNGVYLYTLRTATQTQTRKLTIVR